MIMIIIYKDIIFVYNYILQFNNMCVYMCKIYNYYYIQRIQRGQYIFKHKL